MGEVGYKTLAIDIETFSDVDLIKCGVYAYADSPAFEILLFAYSFDDEETKIIDLAQGEQLTEEIKNALSDVGIIKTAFNANFERTCLSKYMGVRLSPESWVCTAVQSAMLALPLSLEGVGAVLGLSEQKLKEGKELIRYFCVPCKPTKTNGGRSRNLPCHALEKWEQFKTYCIRDVDVEKGIRQKLHKFPIPESEMVFYRLDQEINDRGVLVDRELVEQSITCDLLHKDIVTNRAYEVTGLENPNSVSQLKGWLSERGVEIDSLSKGAVAELIEDADGEVLEALKLRLLMAKTSVKKYEAIERSVCSDGRVHGLLQFYGANRTGRWAGRLVQVQNLPQNHISDLELARSLVRRGQFEELELFYESTPNVLSELIRTAFIPKEGCRFIVADFSAIEARVLAWLSGEQWRLDVFATHGKIYEASASAMFGVPIEEITKGSPLRQKGKIAEGTDSGKLPSFKAMSDFAVSDEQVKITLAKEREKAASEEFDVDTGEWQTMLDLDRQGKVKDTLSNIATIIRFDENLQPIVFNQLKNALDVIGELPWVQVKKGWGDADIACAKLYFERVYGIWSPTKFKDALLAVVSSERLYHPVKEYFSTLSWDGCSRIDSLLIDYMGAENTPYVRAVTRKTLVAAVARIYEPGIKFDSVLVLNGPQGCGKSTFFAKLGKEWYSDSLTISDMKDGKTAAEKLQGYWLLELGELAGIKKVDVETVKSFVTRTDDKYRQSYGTTVESHPRECVIVGSTNSEGGFLRDVTGNRRFWPVHVTGKGKHRGWDLTPETVDQIWAEAISIYKDGEELYLKGKEAAEAYMAQQEAMESDEREGIVEDYLERLLPADWDTMDLYQRRSYLGGGEFEAEGRTGTVVRERFCLMEVWCECFGKERQNFRKTDSYELESIIQKIGGWKKYEGNSSGKMRIPGYGVQRVFVRVKKETAGNK